MFPYLLFGLLGFVGSVILTIVLVQFNVPLLISWLLAINLAAVALYRFDKSQAQLQQLRVPQVILWLSEAAGGTIGAATAMWLIKPPHKTKSLDFLIVFFAILLLQIVLAVWYFGFSK